MDGDKVGFLDQRLQVDIFRMAFLFKSFVLILVITQDPHVKSGAAFRHPFSDSACAHNTKRLAPHLHAGRTCLLFLFDAVVHDNDISGAVQH